MGELLLQQKKVKTQVPVLLRKAKRQFLLQNNFNISHVFKLLEFQGQRDAVNIFSFAFGYALLLSTCMSRQAKIDAPEALQHRIVRGIERREIFCNKNDSDDIHARTLGETKSDCCADLLSPTISRSS